MRSRKPSSKKKKPPSEKKPNVVDHKDTNGEREITNLPPSFTSKSAKKKIWSLSFVIIVLALKLFQWQKATVPYVSSSNARNAIELTFLESWSNYVEDAFGYDVYHPLSHTGQNMVNETKPLGWIVVDSIDTMMLMYNNSENNKQRFKSEIERCEKWIIECLDYDIDHNELNIFETTIRMLGGFLSAYYLSTQFNVGNSTLYLDRAIDLGSRLSTIYENGQRSIPYSSINLFTKQTFKSHADMGASSTAEFTTLQLEFKYLSVLIDDVELWENSERCYDVLYSVNNLLGSYYDGLAPIYVQPDSGRFQGNNIRLGSRGDSFYEYLLKQYLLSPKNSTKFYDLYRGSMEGVKRHLVGKSEPHKLTYIGERVNGIHHSSLSPKMDHLVCFMGGLLMMGATEGNNITWSKKQPWFDSVRWEDWKLGAQITKTCYHMYHDIPGTGLSPEIVVFNTGNGNNEQQQNDWWKSDSGDIYIKPLDKHNLQRPETVESIFFAYHLTKSNVFRKFGWEIYKNFKAHGMTSLNNVLTGEPKDNIESFWYAETLKYLYLLFVDEFDLTKVVFNTEAHIFPVLREQ
ncbi:related to Endoplasmic reticulum mannosyl-oligosaccharide 1,2-alpha-mannosidase [Saccharomycodes ludwigii]|uniref:alpha-1,2-Mannosidase n=1 Tax=Saccharomycodes ludwigii TaxID=36035 RepID=A0A376BA21_9ASCO|nr:related to Endoplasmic reticulum mannosyl-oligosaccharide 1,2-alpha-mannosidase [Saccharomycodes ludwigii]